MGKFIFNTHAPIWHMPVTKVPLYSSTCWSFPHAISHKVLPFFKLLSELLQMMMMMMKAWGRINPGSGSLCIDATQCIAYHFSVYHCIYHCMTVYYSISLYIYIAVWLYDCILCCTQHLSALYHGITASPYEWISLYHCKVNFIRKNSTICITPVTNLQITVVSFLITNQQGKDNILDFAS